MLTSAIDLLRMTRPSVRARFVETGTSQGAKKGWETRKRSGGGGGGQGRLVPGSPEAREYIRQLKASPEYIPKPGERDRLVPGSPEAREYIRQLKASPEYIPKPGERSGGGAPKRYTPPPGGAKGAQRSKDLDAAAAAVMADFKSRGGDVGTGRSFLRAAKKALAQGKATYTGGGQGAEDRALRRAAKAGKKPPASIFG